MIEYFIPYESGIPTALNELGFDEACFGIYNRNEIQTPKATLAIGTLCLVGHTQKGYKHDDYIAAPLYCQVQDWLRLNHEMNLEPYQADSGNYVYSLTTTGANNARIAQAGNYPYRDALLKGIIKAIEIIKRRQNENRS